MHTTATDDDYRRMLTVDNDYGFLGGTDNKSSNAERPTCAAAVGR